MHFGKVENENKTSELSKTIDIIVLVLLCGTSFGKMRFTEAPTSGQKHQHQAYSYC